MWLDALGWTATASFASSYFFREAGALSGIQAAVAVLWMIYGIEIHSAPIFVQPIGRPGSCLHVVAIGARQETERRRRPCRHLSLSSTFTPHQCRTPVELKQLVLQCCCSSAHIEHGLRQPQDLP